MAGVHAVPEENEPAWRERAVARSLNAARSRAEQRVQRFLDAAFELIVEKGTTEFTIRLHDWCDPGEAPRKRGTHHRRAISEFSMHLAVNHADRVRGALAPQTHLLHELVDAAAEAGAIKVADTRRATALIQQTVMFSWFGNRLVENPKQRLTAQETWEFCLHGLDG